MYRLSGGLLTLITLITLCGCNSDSKSGTEKITGEERPAFLQIGEFAVNRISPVRTEVRDGAGRTLVLIPREAPMPTDCAPNQVVRVPVQRVVAYGDFDIATLRALGVQETLVGVTRSKEHWYVPEIKRGMEA